MVNAMTGAHAIVVSITTSTSAAGSLLFRVWARVRDKAHIKEVDGAIAAADARVAKKVP